MNTALLSSLVLVPLVLAPVAWGIGSRRPTTARFVALGAVAAQLGAAVTLLVNAQGAAVTAMGPGRTAGWWSLVMDGLAAPFVVLTALVGLLAVSASWRTVRRPGAHFALLLVMQASVALVFLADNLIVFYIAWESVLLPMFLLIGGWGSANARRAATKFLIFTFAGGAVLLAGVLCSIWLGGSVSVGQIAREGGVSGYQSLVFWLLASGMLVKLPVVPVHTWLPDAHTEAPTAGSIVLAGVLLKMGGYGLIRIALPFAPDAAEQAAPVLVALGLVGIVWGAVTALVQTDLKRLVAYSSVAHMGFVAVSVGVHSPLSLGAAVVTMVSHGLVAGLLFYLVGALYERSHTREIARFGGLGSISPKWSLAFVFASLASAGLPGLSGFPGEFVAAIELFGRFGWWTLILGAGVVLAAAYNLRAVAGTVQGPAGEASRVSDLDAREWVSALFTAAAIVALGIAPHVVSAPLVSFLSDIALYAGGGR